MTDVTINGTNGADVLPAPGFPDLGGLGLLIRGRGGNDTIQGQSGDDSILGGNGADLFIAGEGNDTFDGQNGNDTYNAAQLFTNFGFGGQFVFGFGGIITKGNLGTDLIGNFQVDAFGNIISVNPIENIIAPIGVSNNLIDLSPQVPGQTEAAIGIVDLRDGFITLLDANTEIALFTVNAENFDDITGTRFDDDLRGDNQANEINGRGGDDVILGRGGADELRGGAGDDNLRGGGGSDTLLGGNDDDRLNGQGGNDSAEGGNGNDTFIASAGNDTFIGNGGIDTYNASGLNAGGTFVFGFGGRIDKGNGGNDIIGQFSGLSAEPVEIVIAPVAKDDNTVDLSPQVPGQNPVASAIVDLGNETIELFAGDLANNNSLFEVTVQNFDNIVGTNFGDILIGNAGENLVQGGDGDDTFIGSLGNDQFDGGAGGNDIADYSGIGAAITFAQGGDILKGVTGLLDTTGDLGEDQLGIFDPFDFVERVIAPNGEANNLDNTGGGNISVFVDLNQERIVATVEVPIVGFPGIADIPAGASFEVAIENFVNIAGTDNFADTLRGNAQANEIFGSGGDDTLVGRGGNDTLVGGAGQDTINTGGGRDDVFLTDADDFDFIQNFNVNRDELFIDIAGVTAIDFADFGLDLEVLVDGGALDGTRLAILDNLAGQGGNVDVFFDDAPFVA